MDTLDKNKMESIEKYIERLEDMELQIQKLLLKYEILEAQALESQKRETAKSE